MTKPYPHHPYAEVFPLRDGQPLVELSDHMKKHGQKERIVLFEKKVLSGRRRQLAAIRAGLEPLYREFGSRPEDGTDPLEFAFSDYYRRDDLSLAEKAIAAANYANLKKGDNQHAKDAPSPNKENPVGPEGPTTGEGAAPVGQKEASKKFGVPVRTIKRAKAVIEKGVPELQAAMKDEKVTVTDAASIVSEPAKVQRKALEAVESGKAKTLKGAVKALKAESKDSSAECPKKFARDLSAMIDRAEKLDTKNTDARRLIAEALRGAKALCDRL